MLFFGKSKTFTCPYCYKEHSVTDCGLKCSYNLLGKEEKKCAFGYPKDEDGWIATAYKKKCIDCKEASKQIFCEIEKKEIPIEFLSMKSLPIALLGAKASGKSNYIGVLVNEIKKRMSGPFNCSISMTCSRESKEAYEEWYYRPLFVEGHTVRATDGGTEIPPLIFPLRFMDKKDNITNTAALTFYDTAGENLDDRTTMEKFNSYITNAKGIILLLDPLQVPEIREELINKGFKALPEKNTDTEDILDLIIKVIVDKKGIKDTKKIDIPVALVFTKIDILEQILEAGHCLRDEASHIKRGFFIKKELENTHSEMETLLGTYAESLLTKIKKFEDYRYFGVSSLGGNPNGTKIDSKGIKPRRVLDPLLWLLAENGYVKTLKE